MSGTPETPTAPGLPRLSRRGDRLHAQLDGKDPVPVRALFLRPVHGHQEGISLLGMDKKEVALIHPSTALDPDSQKLLDAEIQQRYPIARIQCIVRTWVDSGQRFWDVQTDRGQRTFLVRNPSANLQPTDDGGLMIKDTAGNRYCIPDLKGLDPLSKTHVARVT
jgi:hypothetical protein